MREDGFRDFPGTYDEYLEKCGDDHLDADVVVLRAKKKPASNAPPPLRVAETSTLSWEEQKRRKNRQKQLPAKRDEMVAAIEAAEARKKEIHARWCEPDHHTRTSPAEIAALEEEEKSLGPKIEALVAEWEAIEKEIEELSR